MKPFPCSLHFQETSFFPLKKNRNLHFRFVKFKIKIKIKNASIGNRRYQNFSLKSFLRHLKNLLYKCSFLFKLFVKRCSMFMNCIIYDLQNDYFLKFVFKTNCCCPKLSIKTKLTNEILITTKNRKYEFFNFSIFCLIFVLSLFVCLSVCLFVYSAVYYFQNILISFYTINILTLLWYTS